MSLHLSPLVAQLNLAHQRKSHQVIPESLKFAFVDRVAFAESSSKDRCLRWTRSSAVTSHYLSIRVANRAFPRDTPGRPLNCRVDGALVLRSSTRSHFRSLCGKYHR